ncbi:MAG: dihydroorotate dehydrogenase [Chloroflexota bacterium]
MQAAELLPAPAQVPPESVDLSVDIGRGLTLPNPILAASGPFGYGVEYAELVDLHRLGGICCRGTTLKPRLGNPGPRFVETPAGLLHAIGLQNPGVDAVIARYAETWASWTAPVVVNVAARSVRDFVEIARRLDGVPGVAAIELNLSCPNVDAGGSLFAADSSAAAEVTAAVRRATDLPLVVKLSPNVTEIRPIARAVAAAGADAVSAINAVAGVAIAQVAGGPSLLGDATGGLSGPAVKPIALRIVSEIVASVKIPVIAIGGVTSLADVLDFLAVGAVAVGVGSAVFADPGLPVRLVESLAETCGTQGMTSYRGLIRTAGARALPRPRGASA